MTGAEWYREQLKTPEWREKRSEIYARDGFGCVDCSKKGVTIHCHHIHYVKGMKPWEYPSYALVTVCEECHARRHNAAIYKHENHDDAEMWWLFMEAEAELVKLELAARVRRIDLLEQRGAIWEPNGRYYALIDKNGGERCYDEDGLPM